MSGNANKDLVVRLIEQVWNRGDLDLLPRLWAGPTRMETVELYQVLTAAFPDLRIEIEDLVAEGDRVVARLRLHGTHRGELLGIEPTAREVSLSVIRIYRIEDGRIAEALSDQDALGLLQQLRAATRAEKSASE